MAGTRYAHGSFRVPVFWGCALHVGDRPGRISLSAVRGDGLRGDRDVDGAIVKRFKDKRSLPGHVAYSLDSSGKGKKVIDAELERRRPLMAEGGYVPLPDHYIQPGARIEDYRYYLEKLAGMRFRYQTCVGLR